jgi:hypothetical protein
MRGDDALSSSVAGMARIARVGFVSSGVRCAPPCRSASYEVFARAGRLAAQAAQAAFACRGCGRD